MEIKNNIEEEEFSLNDIKNQIHLIVTFTKRNLYKLLIIACMGGCIAFLFALFSKPIYSAKTKFLLKESNSTSSLIGSLGGLGSLITGTAGTISPLERTNAIIRSEKIVGNALLRKINVDGKIDLVINHFIEINDLHEVWSNDSLLSKIKFSNQDTVRENLNFNKRKAYRNIINYLISEKSKFLNNNYDKKTGVFVITVNSINEDFSIEFNKILYDAVEIFMYKQNVTSSENSVSILTNKKDSIRTLLNSIQNELARTNDRTLGLLMQEDKVTQKRLLMQEQMLTIMYGEVQKNLETFKFMNESVNTVLEVIETPFSPLLPITKSKRDYTIIGFVFFGFSGFIFLYIKQMLNREK